MEKWAEVLLQNVNVTDIENNKNFIEFLNTGKFLGLNGEQIIVIPHEKLDRYEIVIYYGNIKQSYLLINWSEEKDSRLQIVTGEKEDPNVGLSNELKMFFKRINKTKYIEITFENCESIVLPIEQVKELSILNLAQVENKDGFYKNHTFRSKSVKIVISYKDESELEYNGDDYEEPLGMFRGNPMSNHVSERPNIIGRILNFPDITSIELLNKEEEHLKTVYVPWHPEDEYNNRWMNSETGNNKLTIEIKEQ